jgi:hypothetical protein
MECNTQDYWVFRSLAIIQYFKEHDVLETGSVSKMLCSLEYWTIDKVQKPSNPEWILYYCISTSKNMCKAISYTFSYMIGLTTLPWK